MWQPKEFVPDGFKNYFRLVLAKLRHPDCFIGSPYICRTVVLGRGCSISRDVEIAHGVRIGDYSYVNRGAMIHSGEIGRFCSIGPHVLIGMAEHPTQFASTSPFLYGVKNILDHPVAWEDFSAPPLIGSDVWIGANAFIRQKVRIGHGAIVGAGAVVTRDVPPYAIVAGVPAVVIRHRFPPDRIERLLAWAWWDLSLEELALVAEQFCAPVETERATSIAVGRDR